MVGYVNMRTLRPAENRALQKSHKFLAHPSYTAKEYFAPENDWIREYLNQNNFRLQKDSPPAAIRFVFYQELCAEGVYTFHRQYFACRINSKYFKDLETEGLATSSQKAHLRAVDEGNDPTTWGIFTEREQFLNTFCEHFEVFYQLGGDEQNYLNRQIATRMCGRVIKQLEMLERRTTSPWFQVIQEINCVFRDEEDRLFFLDEVSDPDFTSPEWPLYQSDRKKHAKYAHDEEILASLQDKLLEPWRRDLQSQFILDAMFKQCLNILFNKWCAKLEKLPVLSEDRVARIRMNAISDMLAQLGRLS